jgi:hypothetical protein
LTGTGRGERSGDAPFEGNKRRKKVTIYALHRSRKASLRKERVERFFPDGFPDKNGKRFSARNHRGAEQKSLIQKMSLVAGNVTGGGGKATTTKTYRHSDSKEKRAICYADCVLTGNGSPRAFSGYKKNR